MPGAFESVSSCKLSGMEGTLRRFFMLKTYRKEDKKPRGRILLAIRLLLWIASAGVEKNLRKGLRGH
jgi:hypothetical protein